LKEKITGLLLKKGGKTIAYVVPGETKGYGGAVVLLVAVDTEGKVIDYTCTNKHNETPGLGDKATKITFQGSICWQNFRPAGCNKRTLQTLRIFKQCRSYDFLKSLHKGCKASRRRGC
jgi:electron transport complex protein RnfG